MLSAIQLSFTSIIFAVIATVGVANAAPSAAVTNGTLTSAAAAFGINYGQTFNNDVAWVAGVSQCNFVVVGPIGPNPCGRPFSINGQSGFTFEGCGANLFVNQNNQFYANCGVLNEKDNCGVHSEFHCI